MSNFDGIGRSLFEEKNILILGTIKNFKKRVIYEGGK